MKDFVFDSGGSGDFPRLLEFPSVSLTVIETDGFDRPEILQSPEQTGRRILSAGKKNDCLFFVKD